MLNVYPYYDYMRSNGVIPLDYALFRPLPPNKEAVDASANVPVITEKGDASAEPDANTDNVDTYNSDLIRDRLTAQGSSTGCRRRPRAPRRRPRRRRARPSSMPAQKWGPAAERTTAHAAGRRSRRDMSRGISAKASGPFNAVLALVATFRRAPGVRRRAVVCGGVVARTNGLQAVSGGARGVARSGGRHGLAVAAHDSAGEGEGGDGRAGRRTYLQTARRGAAPWTKVMAMVTACCGVARSTATAWTTTTDNNRRAAGASSWRASLLSPEFDQIRVESMRGISITFLTRYRSGGTPLPASDVRAEALPSLGGTRASRSPKLLPALLCCPSLLACGFLTATHSGTPGGTIFDTNHIAIYI
ncbi:hypothetical protein QYE76_052497 [Lolium multiflorum]|uniref:Uncharacterized protein n=1 Tax=Lolium multiflorum TaxID=4521 RepID=A0AAD8SVQ2_LOLMU|nr:hypothetical protein QYE76_052497 [Lolium multiflorum]